jgi:hypothetical protein
MNNIKFNINYKKNDQKILTVRDIIIISCT